MLRQAGPWGFGVILQVPPRPGPERPPRKGSEQGTAPKSPSQPRPSSHVLGQSQSWGLGVQVSARNLPEISQPFAGISQKAQEMPQVPSGPQGSGVGGGVEWRREWLCCLRPPALNPLTAVPTSAILNPWPQEAPTIPTTPCSPTLRPPARAGALSVGQQVRAGL